MKKNRCVRLALLELGFKPLEEDLEGKLTGGFSEVVPFDTNNCTCINNCDCLPTTTPKVNNDIQPPLLPPVSDNPFCTNWGCL